MQKLKNNVKIVGKYNITFFDAYDKKVPYQGITVEEFDKNDKFIEGSKKTVYFRADRNYIIPSFNTEQEINNLSTYKNHSRLKATRQVSITCYTLRKIRQTLELTMICLDTDISCYSRTRSEFFGSIEHKKKQ